MTDAIVVGAGLAGLAAAARLLEAGREVVVLEARDRVGGRVWTVEDAGHPVELGPEWVGGEGTVHDLLAAGDGGLVEARGRHWRRVHDRWECLDDQPDVVRTLLDRAAATGGPDRTLLEALERCCRGSELAEARAELLAYVEGFHAADPARVSLEWLRVVQESQPPEASELRPRRGLGVAVETLAARVRERAELRLGATVREVHWRPGQVRLVTYGGEELRAAVAVVTVPLPLYDELRFVPDLPGHREARRQMAIGPVRKVVLRFREPFWRDVGPLRDMLFLHAFEQPFPVWWTGIDPDRPVLTGWAGGPQAERAAAAGDTIAVALRSLAQALGRAPGEVRALLEAHHEHDWSADPFARGAYTYVLAGGAEAWRALAKPVERTLYFAGEATCGGGYNATMEGALQSGRRAAAEVLAER